MQHSPIEITNPDGSKRVIMPFGRPWINAEADYLASVAAITPEKPTAVVPAPSTIVPDYTVAANRKMSLREAFYGLYVEPVILFAKMSQPNFMQKNFH